MSRILICWELGGGYGHVATVRNVALALRQRGHEAVFALRDLSIAEDLVGALGFRVLQAPLWLPPPVGLAPPANYTDLLTGYGYLSEDGLAGVVRAWRELFDLVEPDVFVMETAPTALLAARGRTAPRTTLGVGYGCPPLRTPMPAFRPGPDATAARFEAVERRVVATMNAVLERFGAPPVGSVADLFRVDEAFLCTFPELDQYPDREPGQRYWGPTFEVSTGVEPGWPAASGGRVFAYLDPTEPSFAPVLRALRDSGRPVLVHAPRIPDAARREFECASLVVSPGMVRLDRVLADAELIVCNAGAGTASAALLAGRPLLLLPKHLEQYLFTRRVEQLGAGRHWHVNQGEAALRNVLAALLADRRCADAAAGFARAHADYDRAAQADAIAVRIEEILAARSR